MKFLDDVKRKSGVLISENATLLLTAGGVVGTVATAVLTGRAAFKAAEIIRDKELENVAPPASVALDEDDRPTMGLTTTDKVKLVWPHFVMPVAVGSGTVAAIIFSHKMSAQKIAGLAAAYGLAERNLADYKEKVAEKLTGPKAQAIGEEISQDRVNNAGPPQNVVIIEGDILCFDEATDRYFHSSMEKIRSAVNQINAQILSEDYADASDFYHALGLNATRWSGEVGWNSDHMLELKYDTVNAPDGRPCLAISFVNFPRQDFIRKHY